MKKPWPPVENVIAVHDIFLYVFFGVSLVSCYLCSVQVEAMSATVNRTNYF